MEDKKIKVAKKIFWKWTAINQEVFNLRVKNKRHGLNKKDSYRFRVLRLRQKVLSRQLKDLTNGNIYTIFNSKEENE